MTCLEACGNDIDAANKLYNYIASDLKELPDTEPMRPGLLQQADQVMGWVGQHKDEFSQVVGLIQSLRGGNPVAQTISDIPPIPNPTI